MSLLSAQLRTTLRNLDLHLQKQARNARGGERRSRMRGSGGDFADLRSYAVGDDLRRLDWHILARLDELVVRMYEEPKEHGLSILVDTSASMGIGKGSYSLTLAAALAFVALSRQDRVGVFECAPSGRSVGPVRNVRNFHRVDSFLQSIRFQGVTDLASCVGAFARRNIRGSVVLISDFLVPEGRVQALRALAKMRQNTAVLHVLSAEERMPELGVDHTFVDAETGEELLVTVDEHARAAYLEELHALMEEISTECRALRFAHIDVDTSQPLRELVLGPLLHQGLLTAKR